MKFIDSYKKVLTDTKLLSKITTFLIVIILLSEVFQNVYSYLYYAEKSWINENLTLIIISNGFPIIISVVFILRFTFLRFKESRFIWFSQVTWISGWFLILAYRLVTCIFYPNIYFFSGYSDYFVWSSESLAFWLLVYLYLSPIKQISVFFFSLFTQDVKKHMVN